MTKAISLHIGINRIDLKRYGTDGALEGCENDARAMQRIADGLGYSSSVLLTRQATAASVIRAITDAANQLETEDILLLTYAGHGSQVTDTNRDEEDGYDETWVLYDRLFIDDEWEALWAKFKLGVRIVVISDSCHSGSVTRLLFPTPPLGAGADDVVAPVRGRLLSPKIAEDHWNKHRDYYGSIKAASAPGPIAATVLLISGCQDRQMAADGDTNGLFTSQLLQVWSALSDASIDYPGLHARITDLMPEDQQPNYSVIGTPSASFESEFPFSITAKPLAVVTTSPANDSAAPSRLPSVSSPQPPRIPERNPMSSTVHPDEALSLQQRDLQHAIIVLLTDRNFNPSKPIPEETAKLLAELRQLGQKRALTTRDFGAISGPVIAFGIYLVTQVIEGLGILFAPVNETLSLYNHTNAPIRVATFDSGDVLRWIPYEEQVIQPKCAIPLRARGNPIQLRINNVIFRTEKLRAYLYDGSQVVPKND